MATTVMWFRRDLRLADNPALHEAVITAGATGCVVPLFCLDDRLLAASGAPRVTFLLETLRALDDQLGGRLVVRVGDPVEAVSLVAEEVQAASVHVAGDFGPYGSRRDQGVETALAAIGVGFERSGSAYAVDPGTVTRADGGAYQVFGAFQRAWSSVGWPAPLPTPTTVSWIEDVASVRLPSAPLCSAVLPSAGEQAGQAATRRFWEEDLERYAEVRDRPDLDATSRLSPYLKYGCIHPRQLLARLRGGVSHRRFRTELCWREFYADVLHHRPDSARQVMDRRMKAMEVDHGPSVDELFDRWVEGRTGYPIVDAGMRQLATEAWMHNRVRMIVASFLVKDLHIDWRRGARVFMQRLVDGDLASNQHGWQWTAGTGTDAAPYFRVFNPELQGRRFDPEGNYVRRWVPELRDIPGTAVHTPEKAPGGRPAAYPQPLVEHHAERIESLRRWDAVRAATSA